MKSHGHTRGYKLTPEYRSWHAAISNTEQPGAASWFRYSLLGIKVCPEWRRSFEAFLRDMGPKPRGARLRRIDPLGDFEPGNCIWR